MEAIPKSAIKSAIRFGNRFDIRLNTNNHLFVSQVVQKAFVEVNEEGTEAAAATFGCMAPGCSLTASRPPPPPRFTCDRPFMFLIRDNLTGMILFSGQFTAPTK